MAYRKRMKKQTEETTGLATEELSDSGQDSEELELLKEGEPEVVAEVEATVPELEAPSAVTEEPQPKIAKVRERRIVVKKFPRNISKFSKRLS